ncbi:DUF1684 domain-containing protein [Tsukamurella spumae]|uniref:DUF1684 domain-containing protein n=1 Tax=Tsukamurella spumae TaxID=44753 RepID=A0A846X2D6_9ACTN|nr:DUF1684 domain-containing protein [Tsukamurella spumae]NKY18695.1 DUF1684 domain-containing protein [Tsukamurella spumae]
MTATTATPEYAQAWNAWHEHRERELAAPTGWLSITRLERLGREPERFEGIPGRWHHDGVAAYVTAEPGDDLAVQGTRRFETGPVAAGELVRAGDVEIEVVHRGDGYLIRVRDPSAATVQGFRGVPAFEPDPAWVLTGRFEPYAAPRSITVGAVAEGLEHVYLAPGEVVLEHGGVEHRLIAFNGKAGGLQVLFTDETSGVSTYAANRSVSIPLDAGEVLRGGPVTVDLNRAVNLPCAFIDFATCPLPPAGNRLPFAVTAGEKIPYERH